MVGVPAELIESKGAVSAEVALAACRRHSQAHRSDRSVWELRGLPGPAGPRRKNLSDWCTSASRTSAARAKRRFSCRATANAYANFPHSGRSTWYGAIICSRRPDAPAMRLFVAFDLPDEVRRALGELSARLKPLCRAARWARPEGMHVTLKFIGHAIADGDAGGLEAVHASLATVRSSEPVEMRYRDVGFFPDGALAARGLVRSRGLRKSRTACGRVSSAGSNRWEFRAEARGFVPHLTLARFLNRPREWMR